jgi:hypothetical protein
MNTQSLIKLDGQQRPRRKAKPPISDTIFWIMITMLLVKFANILFGTAK